MPEETAPLLTDVAQETLKVRRITAVSEGRLRANFLNDRQNIPRGVDGFILILSGECHYTFQNGMAFTAKSGDLLYLALGSRYRMEVGQEEDYRVIWVDFHFDSEAVRKSAVVPSPDRAKSERNLRRLLRLSAPSGHEPNLDSAEAMSLLYALYADFQSPKDRSYLSLSVRKRLDDAYALLTDRYADPALRISEPAAVAGMSEVYFRKTFLHRYGMTPSEFLTVFRVGQAKSRLLSDFSSVEEIAFSCGFSGVPYFYRVFKKVTGLTPAEFVRRTRQKKA